MSDQAKKVVFEADNIKVMKFVLDFSVHSGEVGVATLDTYLPADHHLIDVQFYTVTALASAGSATLSVGFDDITTEPDNMLNDSAVASYSSAGTVVTGIPVIGTAATHVAVTSDSQVAYEVKTAAFTAGKLVITCILKPYR